MLKTLWCFQVLLIALSSPGGTGPFLVRGDDASRRQTERPKPKLKDGQIAEHMVYLSRVHPVIHDNFPETKDTNTAMGLIQTHESRVSHHHVMRLRETHDEIKAGSLSEKKHVGHDDLDEFDVTSLKDEQASGLSQQRGSDGRVKQASIRLTNLKDSQYVGPLRVGSGGDLLNVVYDTGSTNLWFASTLCQKGPCLRRRRYDPAHSKSYREGDYDLHVTFGTGSLSGQQGIDDVEMAGFTVHQQTFALIEKEEGNIFDQLDFEGILGLAFPKMSANGVPPFFDQVMNQRLLQENAFSFYFTKLPTDASAVFFGHVDSRLYQGDLTSIPVTEQYYWMADLKDFKIGNSLIEGPKKVVFDTGTTYYTAPDSLMQTITSYMPPTSCEDIRWGRSGLPDMTFTLIGHNGVEVPVRIKPNEYFVSSGMDNRCDPAWMPIEVPSPHGPAYIFGEAFMRTFYTVFHRGEREAARPEVRIARLEPHAVDLIRQLKRDGELGVSVMEEKEQQVSEDYGALMEAPAMAAAVQSSLAEEALTSPPLHIKTSDSALTSLTEKAASKAADLLKRLSKQDDDETAQRRPGQQGASQQAMRRESNVF